ncbi:MAG TPA: hypothetical protein VMZ26_11925 [Pyrinomonadaceae bacterium]|nr:hypothetical protein [Pyrinomonadaceae bacterium]
MIEVIVSEITPKIAKIVVIAPRRYPIVRGEKVHFAGSNVIEAEEEHA